MEKVRLYTCDSGVELFKEANESFYAWTEPLGLGEEYEFLVDEKFIEKDGDDDYLVSEKAEIEDFFLF